LVAPQRTTPEPTMQTLQIEFAPTNDDREVCTLDEFLAGNGDDPDLCDKVSALSIGESLMVGGGAAETVRVTRLS
jgi:hypothetical protein